VTVGFFLVDGGSVDGSIGAVCAEALTRSVRQSMPGVPVVQFTDETTQAVDGVDEARRLPSEPMARLRMRHHASVKGEWLFVDSDVIVQKDVRGVFEKPFDVAITTRNWEHLRRANGFTDRMPFNVGVVFSRCHKFWKDAYVALGKLSKESQEWMGDQQAICDLVAHSRYRFAFLKGSRYNFPPYVSEKHGEVDPNAVEESARIERKAHIVHYKGIERKALMLQRIREGVEGTP
jgi:hypothetical protein